MNYDYENETELYDMFEKINNDYDEFANMDLRKWQSWCGNEENYNDFEF